MSADREENSKGHFQAIQDMIPIFCQIVSVNYQRYCILYLEMMPEQPNIYKEFMEGKFVVKTSADFFNTIAPGMKLEQNIQGPKKTAGKTKKNGTTKWDRKKLNGK